MSNVLIAYATREGQTEKIARRIAETLRAGGHSLHLINTEQPPADRGLETSRFQAAILTAPIHSGGYPRSMQRFARENARFLASVPAAFLSVGLPVTSRTGNGRAPSRPIAEKFLEDSGFRPRRVEFVADALAHSMVDLLIRAVMRRIVRKEGVDTDTSRDHEYTDWQALDDFARDFVPTVRSVKVIPASRVHP